MKHTFGGSGNKRLLDQYTKGEKRADGGRISDDSRQEAARLKASADAKSAPAGTGVLGAAAAAGHLLGMAALRGKKLPGLSRGEKIAGGASAGIGTAGATKAYMDRDKVWDAKADRDEATRIERGMAEPGKEDRKNGGRVKR